MRDAMLFALAVPVVYAVGRRLLVAVAVSVMARPNVRRRYRQAVLRRTIETFSDPAFQRSLQEQVRELVEDLGAAVGTVRRT